VLSVATSKDEFEDEYDGEDESHTPSCEDPGPGRIVG